MSSYGLAPYNTSNDAPYASKQPPSPPRTPSPSPSELAELRKGPVDWKKLLDWRTYAHRKYIPWIIGGSVIAVLTVLIALYHKQIVNWLTPVSNKLKDLPGGWIIPIAILFVISFPPLFGHEIVAVLCGVVWGLWVGFAIVAAGTFIGEVGNFYAFRYCCRARGDKLEKENLDYGCLARLVRDGGFKIALIARFSAIPGHFTTAVFSTCGMNIWVFSAAAILSLPKQLVTVYLGVILKNSNDGKEDSKSTIISDVVLVLTFVVTVIAMWWIYRQMSHIKPLVLRERRKAKALKDWQFKNGGGYSSESRENLTSAMAARGMNESTDAFNPNISDEELGGPVSVRPRRWDTFQQTAEWDPERDGGSTAYSPRPTYAGGSQSPRAPPQQIQPPRFSPPASSSSSYPPQQSTKFLPPPGPPPQSYAPVPLEPFVNAPPQLVIPASTPRYQLTDGPVQPAVHTPSPTLPTQYPAYGSTPPPQSSYSPDARTPTTGTATPPRIPPPPVSPRVNAPPPPVHYDDDEPPTPVASYQLPPMGFNANRPSAP